MTDSTDISRPDCRGTAELSTSALTHPQFLIFTPERRSGTALLSSPPAPHRSPARGDQR